MEGDRPEFAPPPAGDDAQPERHSKHPIAVVLPIGAWGASLAFDLLSEYGAPHNRFARLSRDAMLVGVAGAALAGGVGLRDLLRFSPSHRPGALGLFHAGLNIGASAFYSAASLRRAALASEGKSDGPETRPDALAEGRVGVADALANAVVLAVLGVSGTVGGMLAQRFDVRPG